VSCAPYIWMQYSTNASTGLFYASQYTVVYIKWSFISFPSAGQRRRPDSTVLPVSPYATTDSVKRAAWVRRSALRIPLSTQPYGCSASTTGFDESLMHVSIFSERVVSILRTDLESNYDTERAAPDYTRTYHIQLLDIDAWCHVLVYVVISLSLCLAVEWGRW
jgi:hypothetical protein